MSIFFCGIGGSGMLPMAFLVKANGATVVASDRAYDQGKTPDKFAWLRREGITLFPQDGTGLTNEVSALIVSAAVEDSIPDVAAARRLGIPIRKRAELLAELVNAAAKRIVVAGTSGKTTTTGMIGYLAREAGLDPSLMNGGFLRNYAAENPYSCYLCGQSGLFITEADESDGSIALYRPHLAVFNNISLDHKSMDELRALFGDFLGRAEHAVVNLDDAEVRALVGNSPVTGYSLTGRPATLNASDIEHQSGGVSARITCSVSGETAELKLQVPGTHNVANALAAIGTGLWLSLSLSRCCAILAGFTGIKRRLEVVGVKNNITVIDDFAHNPDKISATLQTMRAHPGRLLVMFQPHGFGPLRLMRRELVAAFHTHLGPDDKIYMPEPYYAGGTVDRSTGSREIVTDMAQTGLNAEVFATRAEIAPVLLAAAKPGDRLLIMGARDDTLSDFAAELLAKL